MSINLDKIYSLAISGNNAEAVKEVVSNMKNYEDQINYMVDVVATMIDSNEDIFNNVDNEYTLASLQKSLEYIKDLLKLGQFRNAYTVYDITSRLIVEYYSKADICENNIFTIGMVSYGTGLLKNKKRI